MIQNTKPIFDAARRIKGGPLAQSDVNDLNAAIAAAGRAARGTRLSDAAAFYSAARPMFGNKLVQSQADGIGAIVAAFGAAGSPIAHVAYGLATAMWETARTMQPIDEIGKGKGRTYGKPGRNRGQVAYGRGYVQLTWDDNYEAADEKLDLNGALIANYELAKRPDIASRILVEGMTGGWFTGKSLDDYLPTDGRATAVQFGEARRIINGMDKSSEVAALAMGWQQALTAGGWA